MARIVRGKLTRGEIAVWDGVNSTYTRNDATGGAVTQLRVGDEVDALQAYGSGTARTSATLLSAKTAIAANECTLTLAPGTWTIDENVSLPSTMRVRLPAGTVLAISSGITFTIAGPLFVDNPAGTFKSGSGTLTASNAAGNVYRTPAESAASVTPVNYAIPSHEATAGKVDLRRYGAAETYSAGVNDQAFWITAKSVIAQMPNASGTITGPCRKYRMASGATFVVDTNFGIDFGPGGSGIGTDGMCLDFETYNGTLLRFNDTDTRFTGKWENFQVLGRSVAAGTGSAATSQHGIVVNNRGLYMRNVTIRACGGNGFYGWDSVGGHYEDIYIALCDGDGIQVDESQSANGGAAWGFNTWINVSTTANGGHGRYLKTMSGRDGFYNCDSEQNTGAGRKFGANVVGNQEYNGHSEVNTGGSIVFDATSNHNHIDLIWGDSGGVDVDPVNNGGTGNRWTGQKFASGGGGFNTHRIGPKLLDYSSTSYTAVAASAPNAIPLDDTIPQSSEGVTRLSISYVPKRSGNLLRFSGVAVFSISAGTTAIVSGFIGAATDASFAKAQSTAVDVLVSIPFEYWYTTTSTSSVGLSVNIGSNAAATVTFNGVSSARLFGAIEKSFIQVEEFWP